MFRYKLWLHNSFVEDFPPRFSRSPLAVFFGRQQVGAEFRSSYVLWFLIQLFFFDVTYGIFLHIFGQEIKICFGYTNTVPHTWCKRDTWLMIQSGISGLSDEATAQKACAAIQEKAIRGLNENVLPMIHFIFITAAFSSADIKIICCLDGDKRQNWVFYIPRMSLSTESGPQFSPGRSLWK